MQLSSILVLQTPVATKLLEEVSITLDELSSDEDEFSIGPGFSELLLEF